jgi:hypothetical protein
MSTPTQHSTYSVAMKRFIIMLWCAATVLPIGCASQPDRAQLSVAQSEKNLSQPSPARAAAEAELGSTVASAMPEPRPQVRELIDPGAARVVDHLVQVVGEIDKQETTVISVATLRNVSRCRSEEFAGFQQRVADLLTHAGRDSQLKFTAEPTDEAAYELHGSAYIITADGFDQWELFLALHPAGRSWSIWQAPGPVRLLRTPRPHQVQVFLGQQW